MAYEGLSKFLDFRNLSNPKERFKLEKLIATGTYGEIYLGTDTDNGNDQVAIKIIQNLADNLEEVESEHRILNDLSIHENFPKYIGTYLNKLGNHENDQVWFVMEYMPNGSVAEFAKSYKANDERMPEDIIAYILKEIAKAVQDLHQAHVIYRDLKGMNVLLTNDGRIKLVDFGQCGHVSSTLGKRNTSVGTPHWMSPELIECDQRADVDYDNRVDVWALGITAIELGDGDPPNADIHPVRALLQIVRNPPPNLKRVSDWSNEFVDFVNECLVKNPDHRPVMLEILEHPFLSTVPDDTTEIKKKLISEYSRLQAKDRRLERPQTAIARQGYLKTDRQVKPKKMVTDDLAGLETFNDEIVLETLYSRWKEGNIYTWLADVLISVNPFSEKCRYDEEVQIKYKSKSRSQNDPHIFGVSDRAHQDMLHTHAHQSIILTGESGSGKTFNFSQIVSQLCYIGHSNPGLIDKVKKVCTVLDALGNAVTQLNQDATRHVRYFDVTFSKTGKVSGAVVWLSMLERFRVTERTRGEGNYHIFYYLYDGLSQTSRLTRYGLKLGKRYNYLPKHQLDNEVSNALKFSKVEEALQIIGFTEREIHTVYLTLAAILILGNVEFRGGEEAEIEDMESVKEVCRLLDIEEKKLVWALCNTVVTQADRTVTQAHKNQYQADLTRDALARTLYSRLVDFVVNTINVKLSVTRLVFGDPFAIGVLDMFGFEANDYNTLDNMLINVANEQVQYYYNQYIFNWEMQDYSEEGIPVKNFNFPDNRHILELYLSKDGGIFNLLEEVSRENDSCDIHFAHKMKQKSSSNKQLQPVSEFTFAIAHYVGRVKYDVHGFVDKNKDHISPELVQTLRRSANEHLRGMFTNKLTKTGNLTLEIDEQNNKNKNSNKNKMEKKGSRRFNTKSKARMSQTRQRQSLSTDFRYSLIEILYKVTNSQPHFVRCVRSNMDTSDTIFDREMIRHQIRYHAVCDTIRIRQQGFSHRIPYQEFLRRYQFLAFEFDEVVDITKDNARLLLVRLKMEGWAIGQDKVFLKYYNEEYLSRLYELSVKKIVKIQAMMRAYMERKKKLKGKLKPQPKEEEEEKKKVARQMTEDEAATKIQSNFRGFKTRKENPEVAEKIKSRERFGEDTLQGEAARYVQYYFRKWKMRTLFQQLQIYRADKQQHLVYFSQQVHLYGQEMQAKQQRLNQRLDLSAVRNEAHGTHRQILSKGGVKMAAPKLALDHMINAYFDTTFLCDPTRAKKGRQSDDDWEAPFKSSRKAKTRSENMGMYEQTNKQQQQQQEQQQFDYKTDVKSRLAMFNQGMNQNEPAQHRPTTSSGSGAYNRFAGSSNHRITTPKTTPTTPQSYLKPVTVSSWSDRQQFNGYSNSNRSNGHSNITTGIDEDTQGSFDFRKNLRKTNRLVTEMQERSGSPSAGESGGFNFQGMLRKTNHSRQSMKRGEGEALGRPYSPAAGDTCQSPTFYEETEEAML